MRPLLLIRPIASMAVLLAAQLSLADEADADEARDRAIAAIRELGSVRRASQSGPGVRVEFHLRGRQLNDEGLVHLAAVPDIVVLNLRDTQITSKGLVHIASLKNLRSLHLERTKVDDKAAEVLAKLTDLEYLNLYSTKITDRTLDQLKSLKNLRRLYVWQTKVTEAGISQLENELPELRVIRGVNLAKLPAYQQVAENEPEPKESLKWVAVSAAGEAPKSGEGGSNTQVVFENQSKQPVKLHWVDFGGKLKLYGTIKPGESRRQNSYSGHTWLVTDISDGALGYFIVSEQISRAVIPAS